MKLGHIVRQCIKYINNKKSLTFMICLYFISALHFSKVVNFSLTLFEGRQFQPYTFRRSSISTIGQKHRKNRSTKDKKSSKCLSIPIPIPRKTKVTDPESGLGKSQQKEGRQIMVSRILKSCYFNF